MVFSLLFSAIIAFAQGPKEALPPRISLGLIPSENPQALKKNGTALAKILGQKLGVTVDVFIPKNYQGLVEAMREKKVDYAFFTAMSFVYAERQAGAKVLMKKIWDNPFYYSTVYVAKDSPAKSLKDLKGKQIAFVDEKSTSGFLYPLAALKKSGIKLQDLGGNQFMGTHEKSAQALIDGKVQAAAFFADGMDGSKSAMQRFFEKQSENYRSLWVSEAIPNDPFVVRQDFYEKYPQLTHRMMFAFLDLQEDEKENMLKKYLGINGVMMATSRQYDPVRELVRELDLKLE